MRKIAFSLIAFLALSGTIKAQTLQDSAANNRTSLGFHLMASTISVPNLTPSDSATIGPLWTLGLDAEGYDFDKFGLRFSLRSKAIGDLMWSLGRQLRGKSIITHGGEISQLFDFNFSFNLLTTKKAVAGAGFYFGDYIIGVTRYNAQGQIESNRYTNPSGWWFSAGPAAHVSAYAGKKMAVHLLGHYGFGALQVAKPKGYVSTADYPNPRFLFFNAHIQHNSGVHIGFDFSKAIDMGSFDKSILRNDFYIGYRRIIKN